jgi:DNA helicase TIP49 (TBP-interacting protein)
MEVGNILRVERGCKMAWYDDYKSGSMYISIKMGEKKQMTIRSFEKDTTVAPNFQLAARNKPVGYAYRVETEDDKIFMVNSWALLKELAKVKVDKGDVIEINHRAKGLWEVEKIEEADQGLGTTAENFPF